MTVTSKAPADDDHDSGDIQKELFPPAEGEEHSLWGAEIAKSSTGGKLTREFIEICNEIVEESGKLSQEISLNNNENSKRNSLESVNMLKLKLQETCGSVQQVIYRCIHESLHVYMYACMYCTCNFYSLLVCTY